MNLGVNSNNLSILQFVYLLLDRVQIFHLLASK